MFDFLLVIQYLSMLVLVICVGKLFLSKPSQMASLLMLIAMCSLINQVGTTMSMQATTMDGALIGIKIAYQGKLPILLCLMIFIVRYCGAKPTKLLLSAIGILSAVDIAIMVAVWTTDSNHLFYKTIDYVDGKLFRHLEVTPGVFYWIFIAYVIICLVLITAYVVKYASSGRIKEDRIRMTCLILVPIVAIITLVLFKLGVTAEYDCTNLAYLIDSVILIFAINRYDLIDVVAEAKENIIDHFSDGVIVVDEYGVVVYYNQAALMLFPELKGEKAQKVTSEIEDMYNKKQYFWLGENVYSLRKYEKVVREAVVAVTYVFADYTSNYKLTYADALTGVWNRRALIQTMEELVPKQDDYLVIMDIDNFKSINDTLGHQIGDESLISFSEVLVNLFSHNNVYRYGGDEFVMIVNMDSKELESRLEQVNQILTSEEREHPFHTSGGYVHIDGASDLEALMKRADDALYVVKKSGKGRFAHG